MDFNTFAVMFCEAAKDRDEEGYLWDVIDEQYTQVTFTDYVTALNRYRNLTRMLKLCNRRDWDRTVKEATDVIKSLWEDVMIYKKQ